MSLEEILLGLLVVAILLLLYIAYRLATSQRSSADLGALLTTLKDLATDLGKLQSLAQDVKSFSQDFQSLLAAPQHGRSPSLECYSYTQC